MVYVMVNGLPGNMATKIAGSIVANTRDLDNKSDFKLLHCSLTGPEVIGKTFMLGEAGWVNPITLIKPMERKEEIRGIIDSYNPFISVDFTHPNAVNNNADFYCRHNLPFVMGTTGGDRDALEQRVKDSDIVAVIAPNMAKQIVVFQAMMKYAAENFPDAFKQYSLNITESHQKGKADTSGTAKAMVEKPDRSPGYFNQLGIPFRKDQIKMIRDPDEQLEIGVPEEYLTGHGWHTYTLKSEDETVLFKFIHNVNGRDIYANGTLDAIKYLKKKIDVGEKGKVYSMIDVLKNN